MQSHIGLKNPGKVGVPGVRKLCGNHSQAKILKRREVAGTESDI